ncbi:hypothetical protein CCP3SC15_80016 [Gammaproteobacteria bacterium]
MSTILYDFIIYWFRFFLKLQNYPKWRDYDFDRIKIGFTDCSKDSILIIKFLYLFHN